jgi:hypothetical protein
VGRGGGALRHRRAGLGFDHTPSVHRLGPAISFPSVLISA